MNNSLMKSGNLFLFAALFALTFFTACQPDEEPTPSDARDVYVAAWTCVENSSQIGTTTYTVHINKSTTNTSQVNIENFYNVGFSLSAKADISGNTITINQQTYNGNQLHGSGTKNGANTISLTYYMNNGSSTDNCTANLTRQ